MRPDPLNALIEAVRSLESDGRRVMIVGAVARELVFDRTLGGRPHRVTRDLDVAVRVSGWREYGILAATLTSETQFRLLEPNGITFVDPDGTSLDLLPFGGILEPGAAT